MKIKTTDWHYRQVQWIAPGYKPRSLCPYFWLVVITLALRPFWATWKLVLFLNRPIHRAGVRWSDWDDRRSHEPGFVLPADEHRTGEILIGVWLALVWGVPLVWLGVRLGLDLSPFIPHVGLTLIPLGIGLIIVVAASLTPKWKPTKQKSTKPKREKGPSLLIEFVKAQRSRVCPMLELEDEALAEVQR